MPKGYISKCQKQKGYIGKCNNCILVRLVNFVVTQTIQTSSVPSRVSTMVLKEHLVTLWKLINSFSVTILVENVRRSKSGVTESVTFKVVAFQNLSLRNSRAMRPNTTAIRAKPTLRPPEVE